jgi:hypothetical protein
VQSLLKRLCRTGELLVAASEPGISAVHRSKEAKDLLCCSATLAISFGDNVISSPRAAQVMHGLLESVKKVDLGEGKRISPPDEERLWMIATILILCERAGLASFVRSKSNRRTAEPVPLPKGLINLLEACEKRGLITINRKKFE